MTEGNDIMEFTPFKIKTREPLRYWEDESTGVLVKRGHIVNIDNKKLFRSAELRFALIRSQLVMVEGHATFVFRGQIVKVTPGKDEKNIVTVLANDGVPVKGLDAKVEVAAIITEPKENPGEEGLEIGDEVNVKVKKGKMR